MIPRDLPGLSPREAWGPRPHHILRVGSERQWHHWIRRATTSPGSTLLLFGKGCSFMLHAVTEEELFVHRGLRSIQRSVPGSMRAQRQKVGRGGRNSGTWERHSGQRLIPSRDPEVWGSSFLTRTNQISQHKVWKWRRSAAPPWAWGEGAALSPEAKQKVWKVESDGKDSPVPLSFLPKSSTTFGVSGPYSGHAFWSKLSYDWDNNE